MYIAACTLQNRPTEISDNSGPPCLDDTSYCALFEGHCQADTWGGPAALNTQGGANQVKSLRIKKCHQCCLTQNYFLGINDWALKLLFADFGTYHSKYFL